MLIIPRDLYSAGIAIVITIYNFIFLLKSTLLFKKMAICIQALLMICMLAGINAAPAQDDKKVCICGKKFH